MEVSKCFTVSIFVAVILDLAGCCEFDSIIDQNANIPKLVVSYGDRVKRSDDRFAPIRFHVHAEEPEGKFINEISRVLVKATARVSEILHVIPVKEPILLERTSCMSTWSQGPNKGRCSSLRSRPSGEFCENKIDKYQIPEHHLQRLDVYNYSGAEPILSLPAGNGIPNADYVLYVKTKYTSMCERGDVQAYASYCRLDQYNKPVAGFINFCPSPSRKKAFDVNYFMNIAVHELFHALGFSKDLFPYYSGCAADSPSCYGMKNYFDTDSHGIPRMIFSSVTKQMKLQFDCSENDFGAPLEKVNGSISSHWDPLLLYGSIMASSMDEPEYVSIDPITLAALADSGWYKVNYKAADQYFWGRGEGCSFGLTTDCYSKGNILCNAKEGIPGCDIMHYTRANCEKVSPSHTCGVYKPDIHNECRGKVMEIHGQHLHHLRCFALEIYGEVQTTCAAYDCNAEGEVSVLLKEAWVTCSINDTVKLYDTVLFCPKSDVICSGEDHMQRDRVHMHVFGSAESVSHFQYSLILFSFFSISVIHTYFPFFLHMFM